MSDPHEKRRFFEMAACAMLMGSESSGRRPRDIVNRIGEIWDEIETQCPPPKGSMRSKDDER